MQYNQPRHSAPRYQSALVRQSVCLIQAALVLSYDFLSLELILFPPPTDAHRRNYAAHVYRSLFRPMLELLPLLVATSPLLPPSHFYYRQIGRRPTTLPRRRLLAIRRIAGSSIAISRSSQMLTPLHRILTSFALLCERFLQVERSGVLIIRKDGDAICGHPPSLSQAPAVN